MALIQDTHYELVMENCTCCHGEQLISSQSLNRNSWSSLLDWMQKTQNMPELDPKDRANILDYLAKNYSNKESDELGGILAPTNPLPK